MTAATNQTPSQGCRFKLTKYIASKNNQINIGIDITSYYTYCTNTSFVFLYSYDTSCIIHSENSF